MNTTSFIRASVGRSQKKGGLGKDGVAVPPIMLYLHTLVASGKLDLQSLAIMFKEQCDSLEHHQKVEAYLKRAQALELQVKELFKEVQKQLEKDRKNSRDVVHWNEYDTKKTEPPTRKKTVGFQPSAKSFMHNLIQRAPGRRSSRNSSVESKLAVIDAPSKKNLGIYESLSLDMQAQETRYKTLFEICNKRIFKPMTPESSDFEFLILYVVSQLNLIIPQNGIDSLLEYLVSISLIEELNLEDSVIQKLSSDQIRSLSFFTKFLQTNFDSTMFDVFVNLLFGKSADLTDTSESSPNYWCKAFIHERRLYQEVEKQYDDLLLGDFGIFSGNTNVDQEVNAAFFAAPGSKEYRQRILELNQLFRKAGKEHYSAIADDVMSNFDIKHIILGVYRRYDTLPTGWRNEITNKLKFKQQQEHVLDVFAKPEERSPKRLPRAFILDETAHYHHQNNMPRIYLMEEDFLNREIDLYNRVRQFNLNFVGPIDRRLKQHRDSTKFGISPNVFKLIFMDKYQAIVEIYHEMSLALEPLSLVRYRMTPQEGTPKARMGQNRVDYLYDVMLPFLKDKRLYKAIVDYGLALNKYNLRENLVLPEVPAAENQRIKLGKKIVNKFRKTKISAKGANTSNQFLPGDMGGSFESKPSSLGLSALNRGQTNMNEGDESNFMHMDITEQLQHRSIRKVPQNPLLAQPYNRYHYEVRVAGKIPSADFERMKKQYMKNKDAFKLNIDSNKKLEHVSVEYEHVRHGVNWLYNYSLLQVVEEPLFHLKYLFYSLHEMRKYHSNIPGQSSMYDKLDELKKITKDIAQSLAHDLNYDDINLDGERETFEFVK